MQTVDITAVHAIEGGRLPRYHRDPFDRMLIAQANLEGMTLLTSDRSFGKYKVEQTYCGR
jgi:PIN domain nuclease of toxin-antitoxin system